MRKSERFIWNIRRDVVPLVSVYRRCIRATMDCGVASAPATLLKAGNYLVNVWSCLTAASTKQYCSKWDCSALYFVFKDQSSLKENHIFLVNSLAFDNCCRAGVVPGFFVWSNFLLFLYVLAFLRLSTLIWIASGLILLYVFIPPKDGM